MKQMVTQRVVIKIGASVLTDQHGRLLPDRLERIVDQGVAWRSGEAGTDAAGSGGHRQPILVSSGAIAAGLAKLGLKKNVVGLVLSGESAIKLIRVD